MPHRHLHSDGEVFMDGKHTSCTREDINKIIDSKRVSTLFQPVVSIDKKAIIGFEAFSRGKLDEENLLESSDMFGCDLPPDVRLSLDAVCCNHSLKRFHKFLKGHPWLNLFLNIDGKVLEHLGHANHFLADLTRKSKVPPANIAIEIASDLMERPAVQSFVETCRDDGYCLSIDKVHKKSPLFEILLETRPDFVKLTSSLWEDPADSLFNVDNLKLIIRACRSIGCQPIAIGVENEDDALYLLQCDLYMQQGYYYTSSRKTRSKDRSEDGTNVSGFLKTIEHVHDKFTKLKADIIANKKERFDSRHKMMQRAASKFSSLLPDEFEDALKAVMAGHTDVVSAFIVDGAGHQVTRRLPRDGALRSPRTLAAIRSQGEDHSMTDYHLHLLMGYERFVCPRAASPFLPKPTTLIALRFFTGLNKPYILCIEFT